MTKLDLINKIKKEEAIKQREEKWNKIKELLKQNREKEEKDNELVQ